MTPLKSTFSATSAVFLRIAAISTAALAFVGLYTFYRNNLWHPKVVINSVDYANGVANLTINGKQVKTIVPRCRSESECSVSSPPADCPCNIITLDSLANSVCGAGFWMVSMDYGVCQATTEKGGKGAPETVKCSSKTARCCSFEQQ